MLGCENNIPVYRLDTLKKVDILSISRLQQDRDKKRYVTKTEKLNKKYSNVDFCSKTLTLSK
jgi:hypothetical protein